MPRGPNRPWKAYKAPNTNEHIMASVAGGFADEERGFYRELLYTGCETQERAQEIKQSLFRCARRLGYSLTATIEAGPGGTFDVRFRAIDKAKARAYMVARYGPDRQNWPYNPRARTPRQEQ